MQINASCKARRRQSARASSYISGMRATSCNTSQHTSAVPEGIQHRRARASQSISARTCYNHVASCSTERHRASQASRFIPGAARWRSHDRNAPPVPLDVVDSAADGAPLVEEARTDGFAAKEGAPKPVWASRARAGGRRRGATGALMRAPDPGGGQRDL